MTVIPKVSVLISSYNHAPFLEETIQSVLNQTFQDFELIVVDDGSTDDSRCLLERFQSDPRVGLYFDAHEGASAGRNKGIANARGKYVAFLDSDDSWFPDKLERQVAFLDERPEVALVHGYVQMIDLESRPLPHENLRLQALYRKAQKRGEDYTGLSESALIFSSAALFRKECLDRAGGLDRELESLQDLDLYLRITFHGDRIGFLGGLPVARYRYRGDAGHSDALRSRSYLQVFQKQITLLENTNQVFVYRNAYRNFLFHMANCYYALNELGNAREFSLRTIRFDPKCFFRFSIIRNILMSFISIRILHFLRSAKSAFINGIFQKSGSSETKKCQVS